MYDFRQAVLDDLDEKVKCAIASRSDYDLGNVRGRLIAFALCKVITKAEYDAFHDRLDAAGFETVRILERNFQPLMRKVVINAHWIPFFELSDPAASRLAQTKGIDIKEAKYLDSDRDDLDLVALVEDMGAAVNGEYTDLRIVEIPDDIAWEIRDGGDRPEYVGEAGRTWHAEGPRYLGHGS